MKSKKERVHIYVDESGTFHDDRNTHFVLGGIVVTEEYKQKVKRKYRKILKPFFEKEGPEFELKSSWFKKKRYNEQIEIIEKLDNYFIDKDVRMFSLVVDIKKHKQKSNLDNINNVKNTENMRYNYFLKITLQHLLKEYSNFLCDKDIVLNINCDARTTKVSAKNELENYLIIEVASANDYINELHVSYHDSSSNYLIQIADMVAGLKFKEYNRSHNFTQETLDRVKKIQNILHKQHN